MNFKRFYENANYIYIYNVITLLYNVKWLLYSYIILKCNYCNVVVEETPQRGQLPNKSAGSAR